MSLEARFTSLTLTVHSVDGMSYDMGGEGVEELF